MPTLARGLGWFSVGLGIAELTMPRQIARLVGAHPGPGSSTMIRMMGVRELLNGIAVLTSPRTPVPLWARVAGDAIDLAALGLAALSPESNRLQLAGAAAAVAGVAALDVVAARATQQAYYEANQPVIYSVTINKPPREVYDFYRQLDQLPLFMDYLESVTETDTLTSHWVAKLPLGKTIEWDAAIIEDTPGEVLAWHTTNDSAFALDGRVTFTQTPGRDMTEVRVEMKLGFLGSEPSAMIARFLTKPQVKGDLRRLKQVIETGEVLYSDASAHRLPHPAQPSEDQPPEPVFMPNPTTAEKGKEGVTR
ncbi:MAG: SRPBCC family protein [Kofleriaceae bacterium]